MRAHIIRSFFVLIALFLVGCSHVHDRTGTKVNLYPVNTSLSLHVDNYRSAKKNVSAFIKQHQQQALSQIIHIHYQGHAAKRVMQAAKRQLLAMGVAENMLTIEESGQGNTFIMSLAEYKVRIDDCRYVNYNSLSQFNGDFGCNVEKNRWTSMINPERSAAITESGN